MTFIFMATIIVMCLIKPSIAGDREVLGSFRERLCRLVHLLPPTVHFRCHHGLNLFRLGDGHGIRGTCGHRVAADRLGLWQSLIPNAARVLPLDDDPHCDEHVDPRGRLLPELRPRCSRRQPRRSQNSSPVSARRNCSCCGCCSSSICCLGVFFETLPMLVGTVPILFPLVVEFGVDPVWFGVFVVLMCEISLISPPVGMTLYVIQAVRREGSINDIFQGYLPIFRRHDSLWPS